MPHKILYIEDESAIVELVKIVLQHREIDLTCATCGSEGLSKARQATPALVILDIMMPDMDGWSVYDIIRADAALKDIPIIILTAQLHHYRIMKEFAQSPIDAYITKPFDARALRKQVEQMLGIPLWVARSPAAPECQETDVSTAPALPATHL